MTQTQFTKTVRLFCLSLMIMVVCPGVAGQTGQTGQTGHAGQTGQTRQTRQTGTPPGTRPDPGNDSLDQPAYRVSDTLPYLRLLYADNRYREVISLVDSLGKDAVLTPGLLRYRGLAYFELARYNQALDDFNGIREADSSNTSILLTIGKTCQRLGRVREATETYLELLDRDSLNIAAKVQLGNLLRARGKNKKALEQYLGLIAMDSVNYYYYKQAGRCYQNLDQDSLALLYYEKAYAFNPYDLGMVAEMTNRCLALKKFKKGFAVVNMGLATDPEHLELLKLRGYLYYLTEEYERAITDFSAAYYLDSTQLFTNKYLGLSFFKAIRYGETMESLERAYRADTSDVEITYYLGNSYRYHYQEEKAIDYMHKTISLLAADTSELKNVFVQLAEIHNVLHQFNASIKAYRRAYELDNRDFFFFYQVASIYENGIGDKKKAIEYYEKFLSRSKEFYAGREMNERVKVLHHFVEARINRLNEELFFEQGE